MAGVDLIAFVRARLDEDEKCARQVLDAPLVERPHYPAGGARLTGAIALSFHDLRFDPARTLREVAAKRRMIEETWGSPDHEDMWLHHAKLLATVWDGHPDYREEWRP